MSSFGTPPLKTPRGYVVKVTLAIGPRREHAYFPFAKEGNITHSKLCASRFGDACDSRCAELNDDIAFRAMLTP